MSTSVTLAVVPVDPSRWSTTQVRQSPSFKFLTVPNSGNVTVHLEGGGSAQATLYVDRGSGAPSYVANLREGAQIPASSLDASTLYLIGNVIGGPTVTFTAGFTMPATGVVLPLTSTLGNTQDFVTSLFLPSLRSAQTVLAQAASPNADYGNLFVVPFADATSVQRMLAAFISRWTTGTATGLSTSDAHLIDALRSYTAGTTLWVPLIRFSGWSGTVNGSSPIYELRGYQAYAFGTTGAWDSATIQTFLTLFLFGAHFVTMQDSGVTGALPDFMGAMSTSLSGSLRTGITDSHYASTSFWGASGWFHSSGVAYPNTISGDTIPNPCPLLAAFLMGPTVQGDTASNQRESFFQLEGWQSNGTTSGRHMTDYDSYQATLWNFSTYGASAYSEKRGTTVFIGPAGWTPAVDPASIMAPYVGATPTQSWMSDELVWVSSYPTQRIAAIGLSESTALGSSSSRSGPDFYLDTWALGAHTSMTCYFSGHPNPSAISVTLNRPDGTRHTLTHGATYTLAGNNSKTGAYYLSSPSGAEGGAFLVIFRLGS